MKRNQSLSVPPATRAESTKTACSGAADADQAPAVLITGASSGIGEACVGLLAAQGWRVFAGVRDEQDGLRLVEQAGAEANVHPLQLDVRSPDQIVSAVEIIEAEVGQTGLAGLVNNAGLAIGGPSEHLSVEHFRTSLEVNVLGALMLTQACLPLLRTARGRIINMSSVSGRLALPFLAPYAVSKHALEALSDSMRVELRPWEIHVALIEPGNVQTPIWNKSLASARDFRAGLAPLAEARYGPALDGFEKAASEGQNILPEDVAGRVLVALTAKRPKARYPIGREFILVRLLICLPWRLRDAFISRALPAWGEVDGRSSEESSPRSRLPVQS